MTTADTDRFPVHHIPSGKQPEFYGWDTDGNYCWVWFDGDSEPTRVPCAELEVGP